MWLGVVLVVAVRLALFSADFASVRTHELAAADAHVDEASGSDLERVRVFGRHPSCPAQDAARDDASAALPTESAEAALDLIRFCQERLATVLAEALHLAARVPLYAVAPGST
jgi:hypothetical protein